MCHVMSRGTAGQVSVSCDVKRDSRAGKCVM